ncbi:hypothetical protein RI054_07g38810 [Pseudoscourfieldia marina]
MAAHSTLAPYPTIGTAPSWAADDDIFSSDGLPITLWPLPMHPSENAHPHDNLLEASQQYFVESTNTAVDIVHRKREVFDSLLGGVHMQSLEYFGPAQPQDVLFSTPNTNSDHRFANAAPGCSMVTPPEKPCWQQVAFTNHLKTHQQISQQQRHAHAMPPAMHANSSMNNLSPSVSRPQVTEKAAKPKTKMMPPPPPPPPPPPRTKQSKQNIKEPSTPPNDTDMLPLIPDGTNTSEVLTCPPTKIAKPVLQPPVSPARHSGHASATTDTDTDTTLLVASILANSQSKKRASAARPTGRPATRSTPRKVAVKKVQGQKESPSKTGKKKMAHLPVERKAKKACREKNRRRSMNNAFQELSVLVGQKEDLDKAQVLFSAIKFLKEKGINASTANGVVRPGTAAASPATLPFNDPRRDSLLSSATTAKVQPVL